MDATQFDGLTRALARARTRRGVLRALLGGAGAGLLGTRSASARGPAKTTLCHATGDPAQPWVVITVADPAWPAHEAHGDRRVDPDLRGDPRNCGACAHECPAPRPGTCEGAPLCVDGVCGFAPLPAGTVCRAEAGPCDVAEVCDGGSTACPPDAFAGSDVGCRPASCADGGATPATACPGDAAACPSSPPAVPCFPYACDTAGVACRTACAEAGDIGCAPDAHCDGGECLPDEGLGVPCDEDSDCQSGVCADRVCCRRCDGTCFDDHTAKEGRICTDGGTCAPGPKEECAPFACRDGVCRTTCLSDDDCADGLACDVSGACGSCGGAGEACCRSGGACDFHLECDSGICRACGREREACCAGNTCEGELVCHSDICLRCGGEGEACCGRSCDHHLECDDSDICRACGGRGEPCCAGVPCESGLVCQSDLCGAP